MNPAEMSIEQLEALLIDKRAKEMGKEALRIEAMIRELRDAGYQVTAGAVNRALRYRVAQAVAFIAAKGGEARQTQIARAVGISATNTGRLLKSPEFTRVSRGLYRLTSEAKEQAA